MSDLVTTGVTAVVSSVGTGGLAALYLARVQRKRVSSETKSIEAQVAETVQRVYGETVKHQSKEIAELRTDLTAATDEIDKLQREVRILRDEKQLSEAHLADALTVVDLLLVHDAQHEHGEDLQPPTIPRTLRALIERHATND